MACPYMVSPLLISSALGADTAHKTILFCPALPCQALQVAQARQGKQGQQEQQERQAAPVAQKPLPLLQPLLPSRRRHRRLLLPPLVLLLLPARAR